MITTTLTTAALVLAMTGAAGDAARRSGEYEPNETPPLATPLGPSGSAYAATIESEADVDLFEFYVAENGVEVTFAATNTTARQSTFSIHSIDVEVLDAAGDVVAEPDSFGLDAQQSGVITHAYDPCRYYLSVTELLSRYEFLPKTYTFTHTGATVDEVTMQARCDAARDDVRGATKKLRQAKKKLTRAKFHGTKAEVSRHKKNVHRKKVKVRRAERVADRFCVVL